MRHRALRLLHAEWDRQRGQDAAPGRAALSLARLGPVLGDAFLLSAAPQRFYPFRLAGSRVCALFGGELRDRSFASLVTAQSRPEAAAILADVADDDAPHLLRLTGTADVGAGLDMEAVLLPLAGDRDAPRQILGALVALDAPWWLDQNPVRAMRLLSARRLGSALAEGAPPRLGGAMA
jgi:hypothetical protein